MDFRTSLKILVLDNDIGLFTVNKTYLNRRNSKIFISGFVELKKYSFISFLMNDGMMISEIKNAYILRNLFW